MKQFFTTALGAFVGVWGALIVMSIVSIIISIVFFVAMSGAMASSSTFAPKDSSILYLNLAGSIPERSNPDDSFTKIFSDEVESSNLEDIIKSIDLASTNNKIEGIFINCNSAECGMAKIYEIRKALEAFKKSGKWIYAYGNEAISQSDYYIASVADSVFINPVGLIDISGLSSSTPYMKNMLDKVGIEMQVIRVGSFKSAVEPFILNEMSDENRMQQKHFLGSMWSVIASQMAKSRKMTVADINTIADSILITKPASYLLNNKIVDGTCYKFDFEKKLKRLTDIEDEDDLVLVTPAEMVLTEKKSTAKDEIAILYAVGEINSADKDGIVADDMIENILDLAEDDNVKGLVLRVNSPGGSAFDSEQIWAALEEFKKSGKPYAVSMSDYAASGGYYIACGADKIFAEPLTITGSIGIFGIIPCFQDLLVNKIGITMNNVSTNANGNFPSLATKITPLERQSMQNMVNAGYELFTSRCAKGRNMPIDSLKAIAQGRVWDGASALKIGLVDEIGGIKEAVTWVASQANLTDYATIVKPDQKDFFTKYLSKYAVTKIKSAIISESGEIYKYQEEIKKILNRDHIQARMEITTVN